MTNSLRIVRYIRSILFCFTKGKIINLFIQLSKAEQLELLKALKKISNTNKSFKGLESKIREIFGTEIKFDYTNQSSEHEVTLLTPFGNFTGIGTSKKISKVIAWEKAEKYFNDNLHNFL